MKINKSAARAMDLLLLLAENKEPMTLLDIEHTMEIPKSSTFELVHTLVEKKFVEQDEKKYSLGLNAFKIGVSYSEKLDLITVGREILDDIGRKSKETVFLGKYMQDQIIYVDKVSAYTDMASTCKVGSTKPLYYTALGKAILACLPEIEIDNYFKDLDYYQFTDRTIVTSDRMKEEIVEVRKRGYAIEDREGPSDAYCIAAPVLNYRGDVVAAISITAPGFRMTEEHSQFIGGLIVKGALEFSYRLGFNGNQLYQ